MQLEREGWGPVLYWADQVLDADGYVEEVLMYGRRENTIDGSFVEIGSSRRDAVWLASFLTHPDERERVYGIMRRAAEIDEQLAEMICR